MKGRTSDVPAGIWTVFTHASFHNHPVLLKWRARPRRTRVDAKDISCGVQPKMEEEQELHLISRIDTSTSAFAGACSG